MDGGGATTYAEEAAAEGPVITERVCPGYVAIGLWVEVAG